MVDGDLPARGLAVDDEIPLAPGRSSGTSPGTAVHSHRPALLAVHARVYQDAARLLREPIPMATVTIRNLPDEVRKRLRKRAARAGRSMDAEMRLILAEASMAKERHASAEALRQWVDRLYGDQKPTGVVEDLIAERRRQAASE